MDYFYSPSVTPDTQIIELGEEESRHLSRVLKYRVGDKIVILNGKGLKCFGTISTQKKNSTEVEINQCLKIEKTSFVHIALAAIKSRERLEWFVEKAVELNASSITIFNSRNSIKRNFDLERITRLMITALKQSGNAWLPALSMETNFDTLVKRQFKGDKRIAYCPTGSESHLGKTILPGREILVLIGPEGDFTPEEINLASQYGFQNVSLGPIRLRAETAAMAALMTVNIVNDISRQQK